ncbi:hypothetical protein BDN72DRAFT_881422 [Pluteus cervinus]|uniref:Uncharacterized protein n=1 Tax=Pluteus cervinus TaxID=181527 RepID=A0ACD3AI99_9AGAR|nr:hypothetical protein BDN72DRAFT_881422 [Pluteus cervinus]
MPKGKETEERRKEGYVWVVEYMRLRRGRKIDGKRARCLLPTFLYVSRGGDKIRESQKRMKTRKQKPTSILAEAGVVRGDEVGVEGAVGMGIVCTREMVLLRERGDAYDTDVVVREGDDNDDDGEGDNEVDEGEDPDMGTGVVGVEVEGVRDGDNDDDDDEDGGVDDWLAATVMDKEEKERELAWKRR